MELFTQKLSEGIPLINHTNIRNNIGKYAMVFGKIDSQSKGTIYLNTSEEAGPQIMVKGAQLQIDSPYCAIIGIVEADGSLTYCDSFTEGMENFDFLENYNKLIELYSTKKDLEPYI